jgi:hypothetical protein
MQIVIRPAAAADIEDAFIWYEEQRAGLGSEFLQAAADALEAVRGNPQLHPSDTTQYPKGSTSAFSLRHLLPYLSRFNSGRRVHARKAQPQALAITELMANSTPYADARPAQQLFQGPRSRAGGRERWASRTTRALLLP